MVAVLSVEVMAPPLRSFVLDLRIEWGAFFVVKGFKDSSGLKEVKVALKNETQQNQVVFYGKSVIKMNHFSSRFFEKNKRGSDEQIHTTR